MSCKITTYRIVDPIPSVGSEQWQYLDRAMNRSADALAPKMSRPTQDYQESPPKAWTYKPGCQQFHQSFSPCLRWSVSLEVWLCDHWCNWRNNFCKKRCQLPHLLYRRENSKSKCHGGYLGTVSLPFWISTRKELNGPRTNLAICFSKGSEFNHMTTARMRLIWTWGQSPWLSLTGMAST